MIICSLYARAFVSRRLISFRARASVQYDAVWISSAHFIMFFNHAMHKHTCKIKLFFVIYIIFMPKI